MTSIRHEWEPGPESSPLKDFLSDNITGLDGIEEGEMVTDALVIFRVVNIDTDVESQHGFSERFHFSTSRGLGYALARGMLACVEDQMSNFYWGVLNMEDENDDD